jgi:uncharacterized protein (DUF924 family)
VIDAQAQQVLDFWFGAADDPQHLVSREKWFVKDAAFDAQIQAQFGALIERALLGGIDDWGDTASAALARIVVLDQFTRNAFRGSARAFAGDARALASAQTLVATTQDRMLSGVQRQFVYLPFEHAEDLAMQQQALHLFAQLERDEPALDGLLVWAQRHHDVIERFGRFPHRNEALGRASTAEELEFLRQPGSSF